MPLAFDPPPTGTTDKPPRGRRLTAKSDAVQQPEPR
jgi:hypothetical protein